MGTTAPEGGVMAGDCSVTGAGVWGIEGAAVGGAEAVDPAAAVGAAFTGMNSGPFWPQPANASNSMAGNSMVMPQITGGRYDANIGFTIRITV